MPAALDKNTMKQALKAETKIRRMRRNAEKAIDRVNDKWNTKVEALIGSLPVEVRSVLRAGGVLEATQAAPEAPEAGGDEA